MSKKNVGISYEQFNYDFPSWIRKVVLSKSKIYCELFLHKANAYF